MTKRQLREGFGRLGAIVGLLSAPIGAVLYVTIEQTEKPATLLGWVDDGWPGGFIAWATVYFIFLLICWIAEGFLPGEPSALQDVTWDKLLLLPIGFGIGIVISFVIWKIVDGIDDFLTNDLFRHKSTFTWMILETLRAAIGIAAYCFAFTAIKNIVSLIEVRREPSDRNAPNDPDGNYA